MANKRRIDTLADEVIPKWKRSFVYVKKIEIETWKGALILTFAFGVAVALIWGAKTDIYNSSTAAAASTLSFNPSAPTVTNGASFTLTPTINTGSNHVSIVALRITFDKTRLALDSITPSATFGTVESVASISNTNGTGAIDLSVGNANPSVTGTYAVATLNFHAIATGSASVAFTGAAGASGAAADNEVGNVVISTTPATVTVNLADTNPPTGGSITYTNGYITTASVSLTAADGTDAGSGINTSSRIVQRKSATLSAGNCGSYGTFATITPTGTYPNFTDATVATGNCYQYQYLVSDSASTPNQATYTSTNAAKIDTGAPTGGSMAYTDGYFGSATVALAVLDGTDAVSGVNTASRIVQRKSATLSAGNCGSYGTFATITPTGTYPNFTDATVATGNCYQYQYLVSDNAGKQANFTISNTAKVDTAAPAGGSVTYTNGYFITASVSITATDGTDSASGINSASRTFQRRSATLSAGTCGSYGSWGNIGSTGNQSLTDTTVASGNCYQYQYLVSDNAGKQATFTTSNTAKVDTGAPTGGSMAYTDGFNNTHAVILSTADGTDAVSGVNTASRIVQRKSATLSAGNCGSYGTFATITPTGTYPNFTDATVATGNCYQYQYLVSDNAGKQATFTTSNTAKASYTSDINLDGKSDYLDYGVLHQNYGSTVCGNAADVNADCLVDYLDYGVLHSQYGSSLL